MNRSKATRVFRNKEQTVREGLEGLAYVRYRKQTARKRQECLGNKEQTARRDWSIRETESNPLENNRKHIVLQGLENFEKQRENGSKGIGVSEEQKAYRRLRSKEQAARNGLTHFRNKEQTVREGRD